MTTPFTYDFGYSWLVVWGHLVPIVLFGGLAGLGIWLGWRRWLVIASGVLAVWGIAGLLITHILFRINLPFEPADRPVSLLGIRPRRGCRRGVRPRGGRAAAGAAALDRHGASTSTRATTGSTTTRRSG